MQIPLSTIIQIYACPNCGKEVAVRHPIITMSRARSLFSDGTRFPLWLMTPPSETKCQNCGIFFDLRFPNYVENRQVLFSEEVAHAETLTIEDYIKKIELHLGYELTNRLNMWRYANTNSKAIITEQYRENCKRLIEMLEHTKIDREKLILAELYRNIGEFDKCLSIINLLGPDYDWIKSSFQKQCFAKNTKRFQLPQKYSTYEKDE